MAAVPTLEDRLNGRLPLAFGVSGPLALAGSARRTEYLIAAARASGISLFDTAPAYGAGAGERHVGAALVRDGDAFVMTKAGLSSSGLARRHRNFSPTAIGDSVCASVDRLGRPIDLLWLHGPSAGEVTPQLLETLEGLRAERLLGHVGLAMRVRDDALIEAAAGHVAAVMTPANAATDREWIAGLRARGLKVFGIEVMAGARVSYGLLGGAGARWRWMKRMAGRGDKGAAAGAPSPAEALAAAWESGGADVVVTSTTHGDRIAANARLARAMLETRARAL